MRHLTAARHGLACALCLLPLAAPAADSAAPDLTMEVTATRLPESIVNVPASISVISGEELRQRGANDLRTALSLVAGVEGTPGGDGGPAGAVPALWGLREADAFLLVVDGVPWGGAFNPATASVDLTGVERIEILRGAAPVMFGATSFVGVIHVLHHAAGQAPTTLGVNAGSHGTLGIAATASLPALGSFEQSLTANLERRGHAEDRTEWSRYHLLYRGAAPVGEARFHVDADVSILPQDPAGNLLLRDGRTLHRELPVNANYNPAGAKLDQQRYHLALGLDGTSRLGQWSVTLAATRTNEDLLRGFLRGNAFADPPDAGVGDGLQADGYDQSRGITDVYFDAHVTNEASDELNLTWGADYLYGRGHQDATNFGYCIDAAGRESTCDGARHADELASASNRRNFAGLYAQVDWRVLPALDLLAGLRLNHTRETARGTAIDNTGEAPEVVFDGGESGRHTRLSGVVGASLHAWTSGRDALTFYADYRNTFKPLATDFGPEAEVQVLLPETARSYELGTKARLLDGRLDLDFSAFRMDFRNGLTYADDGTGQFVRTNGGETRFQGLELEADLAVTDTLRLSAHGALHDAKFVRFTRDNGADAAGNRFEMSPRVLGGVGVLYTPPTGLSATLVADYVGARFLNKSNSVRVGGYLVVDATLGWQWDRYRLTLSGYNLTDRREPVAESELHEVVSATGTSGYYRMPARSFRLGLDVGF